LRKNFSGGTFQFLQLAIGGNITIENSNFNGVTMLFLYFSQAKQILITNTTFENITPKTTGNYFITANTRPAQGAYLYLIQDTTFRNFYTPYPLINLVQGNVEFSLVRVVMENIALNPLIRRGTYQELFGEKPVGICVTGERASLTIESSNFTNISENCLGLTATKFEIKSSIFNNSMMAEGDVLTEESYKTVKKNSGITWIASEQTPNAEVILQGNIFLENKRLSLYGGVNSFCWF